MIALSALCAAGAVALLIPSRPVVADTQLLRPVVWWTTAAAGAVAVLVLGLAEVSVRVAVPGAVLGVAALAVIVQVRLAGRRKRADRARGAAVQLVEALVGDLASGSPPELALALAAARWPELGPVARTAELSGDVPAALRQAAERPGWDALTLVAAGWAVAARTGAPLADVLDRIALGAREEEETRDELRAALAAPRSTAKLLALLPGFALVLGTGLGGDPVGFLLADPWGWACLGLGVGLALAGLGWVDVMADRAQP